MDEIENIQKKATKTENKITLKALINYSLLNSTFLLVLLTCVYFFSIKRSLTKIKLKVKNLGKYVSDWSKADQLCLPILVEVAFSTV